MPQKKGAPAPARKSVPASKAARASTAGSRAGAPRTSTRTAVQKPGSKSPKHRGYRPEDAATPESSASPKKPRWSADDRAARGRSQERPRGTASRAQQERDDDYRDRAQRGERGRDARPNWEPRSGQSRFERSTQRAERPYAPRSDRAARPQRSEDAAKARSFEDTAKPRRFEDAGKRQAPRPDRLARAERPRRAEESPRMRDTERRGSRFADRPARDSETQRFVPNEDVVLARLQAQAIEASEVEGIGFADLGLGQNIVRALADLGAETPFPIQAGTIPEVLAGRDVLGRGRTGSGKTIAFGAPLVERLLKLQAGSQKRREVGRSPRALILAPTRELALQIDATVQPIARSVGLFTTQIYGGVPYARQLGALDRGVDIVIGTPGRIQDLSAQGRLDLSQVVVTVLDEADHMCELGFLEPVQEILHRTSEGGQKLLFSATLDSGVASLVDEFLVDPSVYEVAGEDQASGTIEHRVLLLDQRDKLEVLAELAQGDGKKLVFARTRAFAEQLADFLDEAGIDADAIHGDLNQSRRQRALDRFSRGRTTVLVATDVAARGIHVDDVELVIQADAPDEYKAYLHRSGRTGRAGKTGVVVTLVPRNRRRRTEDLLRRAEIDAEWTDVRPGDAVLAQLAASGQGVD